MASPIRTIQKMIDRPSPGLSTTATKKIELTKNFHQKTGGGVPLTKIQSITKKFTV